MAEIKIDQEAIKQALAAAGHHNVTPTSVRAIATVTHGDGTVEEYGTVAFWHKNPLKTLWWNLTHKFFK